MLWVYNNFKSTTTYNSLGHIHNHGTQKDGLMKKMIAKDYFGFLLHLLFHDYNGLVYDYNYNDVMLI
jgi:hypothetical protein